MKRRGRPPKKVVKKIKEKITIEDKGEDKKDERYFLNQAIKNNKAKIIRTLQCNEKNYKKKMKKNCSEDRIKKIKEEIEELMDKRSKIPRKKREKINPVFNNESREKAVETKKLITAYAKKNNIPRKEVSKKYRSSKVKSLRENRDIWKIMDEKFKNKNHEEMIDMVTNEIINKIKASGLVGDGLIGDGLVGDGLVGDGLVGDGIKKNKKINKKIKMNAGCINCKCKC